ncbi:MAG: hypothetical protein WCX64_04160 [Candidatus Micrarchaeia archaeon]|jgi:hypothetical protein
MARKPKAGKARKAVRSRKVVHARGVAVRKAVAASQKSKAMHVSLLAAFVFVILVAILNYVTAILTYTVKLPIYIDTWATSLAVMIAGLWAGIAGGVLYNVAMAYFAWGSTQWVWAFSSIWVAFATWMLYKDGWLSFKNPAKFLVAGLLLALTNTFIVFSISLLAFGKFPTYGSTIYIQEALYNILPNAAVASFGETLLVNVVDKVISLSLATAVFLYVPNKFKAYFHNKW